MLATLIQAAYYTCVDKAELQVIEDDKGARLFQVTTINLADMTACKVANNTQLFLDIVQGTEDRLIDEKYHYNAAPGAKQVINASCSDAFCRKVLNSLVEGDLLNLFIHDNMFRSIVDGEIDVVFEHDDPLPKPYDYYIANGTLTIPLSNISYAFITYKNATTVIWNQANEVITVWNDIMYHYVHIEGTTPACKSLNVEWVDKAEYLPNLEGYHKLQEPQMVNGTSCDVYVKETPRKTTSENATYFADSLYVERFYCVPLNDGECLPVKWETHGKNPYIYHYNEFDFAPDDFVYVVPDYCNQTPASQAESSIQSTSIYGYIRSKQPFAVQVYEAQESQLGQLDLRVRGLSTAVKDQAACGSCWAFATAAMLEGRINVQLDRVHQPLVKVSEQQIISCTWKHNLGCSGGDVAPAVQQLIDDHEGKIPLQSISPYKSFESTCEESAFTSKYGTITKVSRLEKTKEALKAALLDGPVAVATAVPTSFKWYTGGVYNDLECGIGENAELVHAVTVVGWGVDALAGEYWIVKNSWSNSFGVDGYIYIANEVDLCGILQDMVVADVKFVFTSADNIFGIVFGSIIAVCAAVLLGVGLWMYWKRIQANSKQPDEQDKLLGEQE